MSQRRSTMALGLAALALLAAGCRAAGPEVATDIGVTKGPCPQAVNKDHGCIYLGIISDLTSGPFAALAVPLTAAQTAFWQKVNEDGGIGEFDVDVTTFVRDNKYNPELHNQAYQEIKGKVLGLAQTLGSPTTAVILDDLKANNVVSVPASWTSAWAFEDVIVESGTNYCFESMNSVDYAADELGAKSVMAVHFPGDYGADAAAGAKVAAEKRGLTFFDVPTQPGAENQGGAIDAIVKQKPDVVILTTGPLDGAAVVGQSVAGGFKGKFIGTSPTWNPALLKSPAAPAYQASYFQSGPWGPWGTDTEGHKAMRAAAGNQTPNDGYVAGWTWSYPLKAALEKAVEEGELTRQGLLDAVTSLTSVDYQGILPAEAGSYSGDANDRVFRQSVISKVDPAAPTGVSIVKEFFTGPTAQAHQFTGPCFQG